jgi:hypothetical protein
VPSRLRLVQFRLGLEDPAPVPNLRNRPWMCLRLTAWLDIKSGKVLMRVAVSKGHVWQIGAGPWRIFSILHIFLSSLRLLRLCSRTFFSSRSGVVPGTLQ